MRARRLSLRIASAIVIAGTTLAVPAYPSVARTSGGSHGQSTTRVDATSASKQTAGVKIPLFTHPVDGHPTTGPSELTLQLAGLLGQIQPGAAVRIAMYKVIGSKSHLPGVPGDVDRLVKALVSARVDRRADIRLVVDSVTMHSRAIRRLTRHGVVVDPCTGGCFAGRHKAASKSSSADAPTPVMHDKFMTISAVRVPGQSGFRPVVVQMTSNWTNPQLGQRFWNSAIEFAGDSALYAAYRKYWAELDSCARGHACAKAPLPGSFTTPSHVQATLFPRSGPDPILSELGNVKCPSIVDIAVNVWHNDSRGRAILDRLGKLRHAGCDVRTVLPNNESIVPKLAAGLKNGARCTDGGDGKKRNVFSNVPAVHSKYLVINGRYAGAAGATMVFTGSETFGASAKTTNDNTWVTVSDNRRPTDTGDLSVYHAYLADFSAMWGNSLPCSLASKRK